MKLKKDIMLLIEGAKDFLSAKEIKKKERKEKLEELVNRVTELESQVFIKTKDGKVMNINHRRLYDYVVVGLKFASEHSYITYCDTIINYHSDMRTYYKVNTIDLCVPNQNTYNDINEIIKSLGHRFFSFSQQENIEDCFIQKEK